MWQFVQDKLIEAPGGEAALSLHYNAGYAQNKLEASASALSFGLSGISLRQTGAAEPALTVGELALTGGTFNLTERKLLFANLMLGQIAAHTTILDADGNTNWQQLVAPGRVTPPTEKAAAATLVKPDAGAPWQIGISAVEIRDVHFRVVDQGFVRPVTIDIARASLRANVQAAVGAQTTANIEGLAVDLETLRVTGAGAKDPLISLAGVSLSDGQFDLAQKSFQRMRSN